MEEKILDHTRFLTTPTAVAAEAPIGFVGKRDLGRRAAQGKKQVQAEDGHVLRHEPKQQVFLLARLLNR
jgi:hypothetical protein